MSEIAKVVRDAAIVITASSVLALGSNALRRDGIRLVQRDPYDILVPCPEPVGDAREMPATDPLVRDEHTLLIDVRSTEEYATWHVDGATHQPFDWLGPPIDEEVSVVARKAAASGAHRVVVYGDGDDPDSGREWARLLSGARIKNVFFVAGGAPALQAPQPPRKPHE